MVKNNTKQLREKMKKLLMIFGLLSILTTNSFAGGFISLGYIQGLENQTLKDINGNNLNFEKNSVIKVNIGFHNFPHEEKSNPIGYYVGVGIGTQEKSSYEHSNTVLNIGLTRALNNNFVLFGGIGLGEETLNYNNQEENYFTKSKLNVNIGGVAYFGESHYGLFVDYDSALNTVGGGFTLRF